MSEILNGLWSGLLGLDGTNTSDAKSIEGEYIVKVVNNPNEIIANGYNPDKFEMKTGTEYDQRCTNTQGEVKCTVLINILLTIYCASCPAGNFTAPSLTQVFDFLFDFNDSLNQTTNHSIGNVSITDFVSIDTSLIEIPELPSISLPFDISFPNIDLSFFTFVTLSLDTILLIYRWYRTSAIMAKIMRGKSVKVDLHYLRVERVEVPCPCSKKGCQCNQGIKIWCAKVCDMCLNCIIYCDNKIQYCGYNMAKLFYWLQVILCLCILILIVLACYIIVDQVITVQFIEQLGGYTYFFYFFIFLFCLCVFFLCVCFFFLFFLLKNWSINDT